MMHLPWRATTSARANRAARPGDRALHGFPLPGGRLAGGAPRGATLYKVAPSVGAPFGRPRAAKGRPYENFGLLLPVEAAPRQKVSYKNFSSVIKWNEISP